MTRDDGTHKDGGQPGDKDKKPKGKSSFVPRWRQNQAEPLTTPPVEEQAKKPNKFQARWRQNTADSPPQETPAPQPEPTPTLEKKKFQPRWRQNTAEPEPEILNVENTEARLHPNLQQQPEAKEGARGFQPRWRQRAQERAAKEEEARAQAPPLEEKPGFQPRWRRTAASTPGPGPTEQPLPGSDAPLEGQSSKSKGFQPRWRERAERDPVAPAPKAEFTPRWKRTVAAESAPPPALEMPAVEAVAEVESPTEPEPVTPTLEIPEVTKTPADTVPEPIAAAEPVAAPEPLAALTLELAGAPVADAETTFEFAASATPEPVALGAPLALAPLALVAEVPEELPAELEDTTELVAEATVEIVAPPPQPEKKRLPRPQPPPPPKVMERDPVAPARPIVASAVPIPNTEDDDYQAPPAVTVPSFLPGPELLEARVEKARIERAPLVETEVIPEPRKPKRLDDEAMAALKATANAVTRGTPIIANPPPPTPPPSSAARSRSALRPHPPTNGHLRHCRGRPEGGAATTDNPDQKEARSILLAIRENRGRTGRGCYLHPTILSHDWGRSTHPPGPQFLCRLFNGAIGRCHGRCGHQNFLGSPTLSSHRQA